MPAASAISVLVVDDQMTMRSLVRTSLQQIGMRDIREAADGEAGLREIVTKPAHLVISDFNMPNLDGLVQGEANAIAPRKSPLSSMSPTILSKDGKPFMVIGSPGGSRIITITLQAIMNVVDHGMDLQEAIDAPRIHHQWLPDRVFMEPRALSPDTLRLLTGMGYNVGIDPDWTIWGEAAGILVGGKNLAQIEDGDGTGYYGAIDSRASAGAAIGY